MRYLSLLENVTEIHKQLLRANSLTNMAPVFTSSVILVLASADHGEKRTYWTPVSNVLLRNSMVAGTVYKTRN